jgi:predicted nucleic acid-binding protein
MRLFLDSSALAKRYIREPSSSDVIARCRDADEIILSVLCPIEILSGLNRLRREGKLSLADYRALKKDLSADIAQASIVPVDPEIVKIARICLEKSPLRALDAIHVASAKASRCDLFLSADRQQTLAATVSGLNAELLK